MVDDDEAQRRLFSWHLGLEKFDISTANSGLDALTCIQALHPDLVLADISMPQIDGIQMLKIMRQVPRVAMIPVILMTGMPVPESMLQAAADGLKAGPIHVKGNFEQLFDRIKDILGQPTQAARAEASPEHAFRKGPVTVDLLHQEVTVAGRPVPALATKRFNLLVALLRHDGLVTQDVLLTEAWGHKSGDLKLVQMTVARLRDDLKDFPALQIRTEAHSYELLIAPHAAKINR